MNSEFEEYLSRQSFRPIPSEWRAEILRGAQSNGADAAAPPWWREWLWPCPRAWAGLAAVWAFVILLHCAAPSDHQTAANVPPMTWQTFARLQHEMQVLAQLPDWPPPQPVTPQPVPPQHRTSRRVKQNIG